MLACLRHLGGGEEVAMQDGRAEARRTESKHGSEDPPLRMQNKAEEGHDVSCPYKGEDRAE